MLLRVVWYKFTDVSEVLTTSIISAIISLMMEAVSKTKLKIKSSSVLLSWFSGTPYSILNHESKTEDFLFFVFQSVSRANTVNMNSSPLIFLPSSHLSFFVYLSLSFISLTEILCRMVSTPASYSGGSGLNIGPQTGYSD
jgi:hypothetical protein